MEIQIKISMLQAKLHEDTCMNFFKALLSVAFFYTVLWGIFQWGYMKGADAERYSRYYAHTKLQHCQELIGAK